MPSKVFVLVSFMLVFTIVQCHAKLLSFSDEQNASSVSDEDNFDKVLESAIKTYQVNYNLNVTGTLDAETLSMLPRCGVPDIINGETSMRSRKDKTMQDHHGQNKKVHMVSHYDLFKRRLKWPSAKPNLTYRFDTNGSDVAFLNLIDRAFNQWVSGTNSFKFSIAKNSASANIKIGVYKRSHFDGFPFDGPYDPKSTKSNTLAHAFPPTDGKLHFDGDENWALGSSAGPTQFHMESIAVHEIGHIIGLNHSSVVSSIMFPYIIPGLVKVKLDADDKAGIKDLYG